MDGELEGTDVGVLLGIAQNSEHISRGHSVVGEDVGTKVGTDVGVKVGDIDGR